MILPSGAALALYASARVLSALEELTEQPFSEGVRPSEIMEAFYKQGQRNGRREIIEEFAEKMDDLRARVEYLPPGRPKKKKKH